MTNLRWIGVSLMAAVLVFAVACSGGSDDDGSSTGSTGVAASTGSSAATGSTGSTGSSAATGSTGSTGSTGATGSGTVNVDSLGANLEDLDSFRFVMKINMDFDTPEGATGSEDAAAAAMLMALLGNIEVEGAYQAPDRVSMSMTFFGMDIQTIQIGDESWTNDGTGWMKDVTGGSDVLPFDVTSPGDMFDFVPDDQLEGAETSRETVNGFETTKYHFDKEALATLAEASGEAFDMAELDEVTSFNLNLWITDDGLPVKMQMEMKGESEGSDIAVGIEFNITDVNDSSIQIDRPI